MDDESNQQRQEGRSHDGGEFELERKAQGRADALSERLPLGQHVRDDLVAYRVRQFVTLGQQIGEQVAPKRRDLVDQPIDAHRQVFGPAERHIDFRFLGDERLPLLGDAFGLGRFILCGRRSDLLQPRIDFADAWAECHAAGQSLGENLFEVQPYLDETQIVVRVGDDILVCLVDLSGQSVENRLLFREDASALLLLLLVLRLSGGECEGARDKAGHQELQPMRDEVCWSRHRFAGNMQNSTLIDGRSGRSKKTGARASRVGHPKGHGVIVALRPCRPDSVPLLRSKR
jgi:hypothetical protein